MKKVEKRVFIFSSVSVSLRIQIVMPEMLPYVFKGISNFMALKNVCSNCSLNEICVFCNLLNC